MLISELSKRPNAVKRNRNKGGARATFEGLESRLLRSASGFAGVFTAESANGTAIKVDLAPSRGRYLGELFVGTSQSPITATVSRGELQGVVQYNGGSFDISATFKGADMDADLGGYATKLTRTTSSYRIGPTFSYEVPVGWRSTQAAGKLILTSLATRQRVFFGVAASTDVPSGAAFLNTLLPKGSSLQTETEQSGIQTVTFNSNSAQSTMNVSDGELAGKQVFAGTGISMDLSGDGDSADVASILQSTRLVANASIPNAPRAPLPRTLSGGATGSANGGTPVSSGSTEGYYNGVAAEGAYVSNLEAEQSAGDAISGIFSEGEEPAV